MLSEKVNGYSLILVDMPKLILSFISNLQKNGIIYFFLLTFMVTFPLYRSHFSSGSGSYQIMRRSAFFPGQQKIPHTKVCGILVPFTSHPGSLQCSFCCPQGAATSHRKQPSGLWHGWHRQPPDGSELFPSLPVGA